MAVDKQNETVDPVEIKEEPKVEQTDNANGTDKIMSLGRLFFYVPLRFALVNLPALIPAFLITIKASSLIDTFSSSRVVQCILYAVAVVLLTVVLRLIFRFLWGRARTATNKNVKIVSLTLLFLYIFACYGFLAGNIIQAVFPENMAIAIGGGAFLGICGCWYYIDRMRKSLRTGTDGL